MGREAAWRSRADLYPGPHRRLDAWTLAPVRHAEPFIVDVSGARLRKAGEEQLQPLNELRLNLSNYVAETYISFITDKRSLTQYKRAAMDSSTGTKAHIAAHLLSLAHLPDRAQEIFKDKVKLRPLHLKPGEGQTPDARDYRRKVRLQAEERRKKKRKPQPLSAREKRETGLHQIPKEQRKYNIFEPLNKLWVGYMHEVLGPGRPVTSVAAAKLASADYHGALVEVSRSRCPSRVGVKGIVVKDTKYTFEIINKASEIKVLPKEHTVFRFEVPEQIPATSEKKEEGTMEVDSEPKKAPKNLVFELHGDQFQHRAVDRANKKFKQHFLPDI